MNKSITIKEKGAFFVIYYDDKEELGSFFTMKTALEEMNLIIRQINKGVGVVQVNGLNTENTQCYHCDYFTKGKCYYRKKHILKHCPYLNGTVPKVKVQKNIESKPATQQKEVEVAPDEVKQQTEVKAVTPEVKQQAEVKAIISDEKMQAKVEVATTDEKSQTEIKNQQKNSDNK